MTPEEVRALVDRAQQAVWYGPSAWDAALDDVSEQITVEMQKLRGAQTTERVDLDELEAVARRLATRGHGADAKRVLRACGELEIRRASVTTGGPAPAFTQQWENGPSTRPPTAPPEPEVVELPAGALPCGCEGPSATCADKPAVDYIDEPPAR